MPFKLAVLTSGGDAPGMNAAIRSVVRTGLNEGFQVSGVFHGLQGLLDDEIQPLHRGSVANILQRGGTMLKTSRCPKFHLKSYRKIAAANLRKQGIGGLIVIGGDGSFRGAQALQKDFGISTIGIPGTIDNDIPGTDETIGFDTAVNTALEAIDRIRDTATSHDRLFLVEVMGRHHGAIALQVGIAGGAERVLLPEVPFALKKLTRGLDRAIARGKKSSILVVAEGALGGKGAQLLDRQLLKAGYDPRICILGHTQRGGRPTARDRYLAAQLGAYAVKLLAKGRSGGMVGTDRGEVIFRPYGKLLQSKKKLSQDQMRLVEILAT